MGEERREMGGGDDSSIMNNHILSNYLGLVPRTHISLQTSVSPVPGHPKPLSALIVFLHALGTWKLPQAHTDTHALKKLKTSICTI